MKAVLKNLAEAGGGRYHCYSSKGEVGDKERGKAFFSLANDSSL